MKTYNDHPLNNCVIKCESIEHGKKIIEFWKKQGVYTGVLSGENTSGYYGLLHGSFSVYFKDSLTEDIKIIHLPSEEIQLTDLSTLHMKEMMVSDDGKVWFKRCVFGMREGRYYAFSYNSFYIWPFAKEIPAKINVTIEEIAAWKGTTVEGINIVK